MLALLDFVAGCESGRERLLAFVLSPYSGVSGEDATSIDRAWRRRRVSGHDLISAASLLADACGRAVTLARAVEAKPVGEVAERWKELADSMLACSATANGMIGEGAALDAAAHRAVLSVVRVADFGAALDLVNRHEYGNGTAIFTRDGDTARAFAASIEVGMVGINVPIPVPVSYYSFGGQRVAMRDMPTAFGPVSAFWPAQRCLRGLPENPAPMTIRAALARLTPWPASPARSATTAQTTKTSTPPIKNHGSNRSVTGQ